MGNRNSLLDLLKGIAIVSVILYHAGFLENGYLGVDVFLVICGFLTTKTLIRKMDTNGYAKPFTLYFNFENDRLFRLWPLVLIVSAIALIVGWLWMMPWNYKLNCEAVAATSVFANNIIQYITTGDYWDGANETKPLMHTWYIALVMQFYIVFPIIILVVKRYFKSFSTTLSFILFALCLLSIIIFLLPVPDFTQDFYLLPSRLFEFILGAIIALGTTDNNSRNIKVVIYSILCLIVIISSCEIEFSKLKLLFTTLASALLLYYISIGDFKPYCWTKPIAFLGKASFSLYLWHQLIFAFYRLFFVKHNNGDLDMILVTLLAIIVGLISYMFIEKGLNQLSQSIKAKRIVNCVCAIFAVVLAGISTYYYTQNGVVRDIPELDIYCSNPYDNIPQDYNNRIYNLDKEFPCNGKKNVLVLGDSYARDWTNVLIESGIDTIMNISCRMPDDSIALSRIQQADIIFLANDVKWSEEYSHVTPLLLSKKFYRIGVKRFTLNVTNLLNFSPHNLLYDHEADVWASCLNVNEEESKIFGNRYIDIIGVLKNNNGKVKVFTEGNKLISHDGGHLTRAGAQFLSKQIDVWEYLRE